MSNSILATSNGAASGTMTTTTNKHNKAPFSFHCTICIEPFHPSDRPPVVLPCGHTYLCLPCSKRIDRCTECRASLYMTPKSSSTPHHHQQSHYMSTADSYDRHATGRRQSMSMPDHHHHHHGSYLTAQQRALQARYGTQFSPVSRQVFRNPPQNKTNKEEAIALPLPKNLVLLELMEAADRSASASASAADPVSSSSGARDKEKDATKNNIGSSADEHNIIDYGYESGEDNKRVFRGIHALAGPCGTYAVRCEQGLKILDSYPTRTRVKEEAKEPEESKNREMKDDDKDSSDDRSVAVDDLPAQGILPTGSIVQVVSIETGAGENQVNELARSAGYIVASSKQLVKVGAPQDKACQIEGMLKSTKLEKKELQKKLVEINKLETGLRKDLNKALQKGDVPSAIVLPPVAPSINATASTSSLAVMDDDEGIIEVSFEVDDDSHVDSGGDDDSLSDRIASPPTIRIVSALSNLAMSTVKPGVQDPSLNQDDEWNHHSFRTVDNSDLYRSPTNKLGNNRHRVDSTQPLKIFSCSDMFGRRYSTDGVDDLFGESSDEDDNRLMGLSVESEFVGTSMRAREQGPPSPSFVRFPLQRASPVRESAEERWAPERLQSQRVSTVGESAVGRRAPQHRCQPQRALSTHASVGERWSPEHHHPPSASSSHSYESVNFRTGLSGHRALSSSRTKPDHNMTAHKNRNKPRMMGEHRGISNIRSRMLQRHSVI